MSMVVSMNSLLFHVFTVYNHLETKLNKKMPSILIKRSLHSCVTIFACLSVSPCSWRSVRPSSCWESIPLRLPLLLSFSENWPVRRVSRGSWDWIPLLLCFLAGAPTPSHRCSYSFCQHATHVIGRDCQNPPAWPMTASQAGSHWSSGGGSTDITLTAPGQAPAIVRHPNSSVPV